MALTNASSKMLMMAAENDGVLPTFAWPGGYPLVYWDKDCNELCPDCANKNDDYSPPITDFCINWEDNNRYCAHCNAKIDAAYDTDAPDDSEYAENDEYDGSNDSYGDCASE